MPSTVFFDSNKLNADLDFSLLQYHIQMIVIRVTLVALISPPVHNSCETVIFIEIHYFHVG